jgi:3-oxoadipate enol-lactonase
MSGGESRFLSAADGTRLHYQAFGDPGGVPVLLVHGLAAGAAQWQADAQALAENGFFVLVPDLRGHGRSGMPRLLDPQSFSFEIMAGDLMRVLDHADISKVHWVGNSLGGVLAFALLEKASHRFASLVTFGAAPRLDLPRFVPAVFPLAGRLLGRRLLAWLTARLTTPDKIGQRTVYELTLAFDLEVGRMIATLLRHYDLTAALETACVPALLVRGGRDRLINRALRKALPQLLRKPHIGLIELPTGGHCANLDARADLHRALKAFWGQTGPV